MLLLELPDLQQKVKYLYKSLGANVVSLKRFPSYITYDLVLATPSLVLQCIDLSPCTQSFIITRAEFLRALGMDPCFNGLQFLLASSAQELALCAGTSEDAFCSFQKTFREKLAKRNLHL